MKTRTPTQPLAIKAEIHYPALCLDCGLFFSWIHQTKHDGCPECNSKNWYGTADIREACITHSKEIKQ
jgi:predicted Zn-ribbon and HTH transcriptional regulator